MAHLNQSKGFILTEPYGPDNPERWDADKILAAAKKFPEKLIVLGGGGTLNGMIIASYRSGDAGPEAQRKFRDKAEELLRSGIAGFGEMSNELKPTDNSWPRASGIVARATAIIGVEVGLSHQAAEALIASVAIAR